MVGGAAIPLKHFALLKVIRVSFFSRVRVLCFVGIAEKWGNNNFGIQYPAGPEYFFNV